PKQGRLRYREDHFVSETGEVTNVRSRLTLIGQTRERKFTEEVILSRSRYIAPATQSLRFYQEYFKPAQTLEIEKDRVRFLVNFKDEEFFINIDTFMKPQLGNFLEIKSRTWSRQDAEKKSEFTIELLQNLGTQISDAILDDYVEILKNK
ncbi:MAG: amidohydrolase, partial [Anaerolineaceae bacterium]